MIDLGQEHFHAETSARVFKPESLAKRQRRSPPVVVQLTPALCGFSQPFGNFWAGHVWIFLISFLIVFLIDDIEIFRRVAEEPWHRIDVS
jgi:hypothetical protein